MRGVFEVDFGRFATSLLKFVSLLVRCSIYDLLTFSCLQFIGVKITLEPNRWGFQSYWTWGLARFFLSSNLFYNHSFRHTAALRLAVTSRVSRASMAAARRILVKMEEHAQKYVRPWAFGTAALAQEDFLANTVSLKEKAARPIRLQEKGVLDCTQSLMTAINPSKCFVTLPLNPGLHGTWSNRSAYQIKVFLG